MGTGAQCGGCKLEHLGKGFTQVEVGARYDATRLLVVAEASGENEVRESLPLRPYAPAGGVFARALKNSNISRAEIAITNVLRCSPPGNALEGMWYQYGAIHHCTDNYLRHAIAELKPRAILALGGIAYRMLTDAPKGRYGTLDYVRGYAMPGSGLAENVPVIPTYHPSHIRRGKPELGVLLERDLRHAHGIATGRLVEGRQFVYDLRSLPLRYQKRPTLAEAWAWAEAIDLDLPLSWDLETKVSVLEDEDARLPSRDAVRLFQATQRRGEGIAIPFREEYAEVVRHILSRPVHKVGFNLWRYDELVAEANKIVVDASRGSDDAMVMFGRWQPDLPANLQTAAQFCGFMAPWKHLNDVDEEFYGVADVDAALCVWQVTKRALIDLDVWDWYETYHAKFWPMLRAASGRGIPINEEKRAKLLRTLERFEHTNLAQVRRYVPREVLSTKQKNGYKNPPILKCEDCGYAGRGDHVCADLRAVAYAELAESHGLVERDVVIEEEEKCRCTKKSRGSCAVCAGSGIIPTGLVERRWAAPKEFNPNSGQQVIRLMRHLKHSVPKHQKRTTEDGEAADTTEVKELERLAAKTKHPIYPLMIRGRQITKSKGTYHDGYAPDVDGAVHPTFTYKPATGQLSAIHPNGQNQPKRGRSRFQNLLVGRFRAMIHARPGHVIVNHDWKAFHALTTGFEANSELYMRLARNDMHSFVAAHWLKLPERQWLLNRDDADMKALFKHWRMTMAGFEDNRQKAKAVGLGVGFGQRPKSIFEQRREDFNSLSEVQAIWNLLMVELFPDVARWQRETVQEAADEGKLQARSGAVRWFCEAMRWDHRSQRFVYGDQAEQAIAFRPANDAFFHCRWTMLNMEARGMPEKYRLFNNVHDSLEHEPLVELTDECVREVKMEMERPSPVLVSKLVPSGLIVEADASVGESMADLRAVG